MGTSLLELVLAIALSAVVLGSAIGPLISALVGYQSTETELRARTAHSLAAARIEQVASTLWRDPNGPAGTATLQTATSSQLTVGTTSVRSAARLEQSIGGSAWAPLTDSVTAFAGAYLLNDGAWYASVPSGQSARVVALRFNWREPASETVYAVICVPLDRAFSASQLSLLAPTNPPAYSRANYTRTVTFNVGNWP